VNSAELKRAKRTARRRVLEARDEVSATDRSRLATIVTQRFLSLPEVRGAETVLAFWSFGSEVGTGPLIEGLIARGATVALPRIVGGELEARTYRPGDAVIETTFGAMEPAAGPVVEPESLDVVVTPAVAFDRDGQRVGYGGGYYDRFLPRTRPDTTRIGLGFGVQLLAEGESLPAGHFDLRVDVVVTESETVRCPRRS
jgi:5-formyltetrahydrofolate cyclo-ligase